MNDLQARLSRLVKKHGSVNAVGRATGVSPDVIWRAIRTGNMPTKGRLHEVLKISHPTRTEAKVLEVRDRFLAAGRPLIIAYVARAAGVCERITRRVLCAHGRPRGRVDRPLGRIGTPDEPSRARDPSPADIAAIERRWAEVRAEKRAQGETRKRHPLEVRVYRDPRRMFA